MLWRLLLVASAASAALNQWTPVVPDIPLSPAARAMHTAVAISDVELVVFGGYVRFFAGGLGFGKLTRPRFSLGRTCRCP